jgi:hypothetical protein
MLKADFFAEGLELVEPRRSQVTAGSSLDVTVNNPRRRDLMADRRRPDGADEADCAVWNGLSATVHCAFAAPGTYRVRLFSAGRHDITHWMVGEIEVQSR